jgi:hypothetical protein
VLSKYDYVSVSRLHYQLPVVALLAALAVDRAIAVGETFGWPPPPPAGQPTFRVDYSAVIGVVVVGLITYGNLHRWFVEDPPSLASTPDAVTIRVLEDPRCAGTPWVPLVVDRSRSDGLAMVLEAIGGLPRPDYVAYDEPGTWLATVGSRCVIFRLPYDDQAVQLEQFLGEQWPTVRFDDVYDYSGERRVRVYYPL